MQKNRQNINFLIKYSEKALDSKIAILRTRFANDCARLETVNPFAVLKRGYAVINDENNRQILSVNQLKQGQDIYIKLND